MTTEEQLRERLRKITALFEGAATAGERQAAAAAIERIRKALHNAVGTEPLPEAKFSMADQWQRRLFSALCRRYGLEPYRYKGQRHTTVMVRAPVFCGEHALAGIRGVAGGPALLSQPGHGTYHSGRSVRRRGRRGGTDRITCDPIRGRFIRACPCVFEGARARRTGHRNLYRLIHDNDLMNRQGFSAARLRTIAPP